MPCSGMRSSLTELLRTRVKSDSPSQLSELIPVTACPDCGWKITHDFRWCPQCGVRIKPVQCTFCRGWVPQGMDSCPSCGAPA